MKERRKENRDVKFLKLEAENKELRFKLNKAIGWFPYLTSSEREELEPPKKDN